LLLATWLAPPAEEWPEPALRQVPFLLRAQPRELGILATRGPRRPNPLGLSLVRIVAIEGTTIRFAGVDMVDGTPLFGPQAIRGPVR
jgi:tRNA (adenine37-N6)-methyltransferase